MRNRLSLAVLLLLPLITVPVRAYSPDDRPPDQQSIDALRARISQAQPREQCYLYAELMHQMTEFSVREYAAGNVDKASDLLKQVQQIAHKFHLSLADNDKRLKNAEILLRHTAFRLGEMLHSSSYEDRPLVAETLAQVSQIQNDTLLGVLRK